MNSALDANLTTQTILLVDDRPENLIALEAILEAPNRQFLQALNGHEALAQALKQEISLILLDVRMPDMDGFEVAELLHRNPRTREIPVIFCTAINKEKKYISRGFEVGAIDYLFKPLDTDVLKAKVRAFLELDAQKRNLQQMTVDLLHARQQADIAASEAQAARDQLQSLLDCAPVMVIATDREGIVRFSNTPPEQPGYWPSLGCNWLAPVPAGQRPPLEAIFRDVLATGISRSHETSGPAADGSFRFFLNHVGPMRHGTDIIGAVIASRDVTDQKRVQAELEASQRLATVGSLAAGVAHEINNPIQFVGDSLHFLRDTSTDIFNLIDRLLAVHNAITGNATQTDIDAAVAAANTATTAADLLYLRESVPKALMLSIDGLDRVAMIVRSMQEFSRADQQNMAPTDLNRAIQHTLAVGCNEYKHLAEIQTDFGELPLVTCHPADINRAVLSIVINAAHAIGDVVKGTQGKGKIVVTTRLDKTDAVISISDTGGGIPENIREHIFDPFFTTREVGKGTGQGLAIAWTIIREKHGGELSFQTRAGNGTTFLIRIPVAGHPANREAHPIIPPQ
ncbi:MAG: response regulator [Pseudomonadota bacterium]